MYQKVEQLVMLVNDESKKTTELDFFARLMSHEALYRGEPCRKAAASSREVQREETIKFLKKPN